MSKNRIQILACVIALSGCAPAYKITPSYETAKVRFRTEANAWVNVSSFASEQCTPNPDGEKLGGIGQGDHFSLISPQPNTLNMLGSENPTTKRIERVVRAGRPFFFAFEHVYLDRPGVGCNKTLSFVPQANHEYEAQFFLSGDNCNAKVLSVVVATSSDSYPI